MPTLENYGSISRQPIEINGTTRTLADWARYYMLPYKTVAMRWKRGHRDPAKLFFHNKYFVDGQARREGI